MTGTMLHADVTDLEKVVEILLHLKEKNDNIHCGGAACVYS